MTTPKVAASTTNLPNVPYPTTKQIPVVSKLFGQQISDPFRWLEAKTPEVHDWVREQDVFARGMVEDTPFISARFEDMFYRENSTLPVNIGGRLFFARRTAQAETYQYFWRSEMDEEGTNEHVLLDPIVISPNGIDGVERSSTSPKGKYITYNIHPNNGDESILHIRDVETGLNLESEVITEIKYNNPSWLPDESGFYYTSCPNNHSVSEDMRSGQSVIKFHKIGTDPAMDPTIVGAVNDPQINIHAEVIGEEGEWLVVYKVEGWSRASIDISYIGDGAYNFLTLLPNTDSNTQIKYHDGYLYLLSTDEHQNGYIKRMPETNVQPSKWKMVVPPDNDRVLDNAVFTDTSIVVHYKINCLSELFLYSYKNADREQIILPSDGVVTDLTYFKEGEDLIVSYSALLQPEQKLVYDLDARTFEELPNKNQFQFDASQFKAEHISYLSKDGTAIPMYLIYPRDVNFDGSTPTILYGYGGFNVAMEPEFNAKIVPWLELGGAYAIANLRGGGGMGEDWHRAGMKENKQNVFDDFIAGARYLIDRNLTSPARLGGMGASNGGLLVGAALTQRPELFRAIVCGVPLLDMVRYHLHGMGRTWIPEYGDPEIENEFEYLRKYSPYHNVKAGVNYPAVLFASAENDDRVSPMHARKMAALLQAASSSHLPILLRTPKNQGHAGGSHVATWIAGATFEFSFFKDQLGL